MPRPRPYYYDSAGNKWPVFNDALDEAAYLAEQDAEARDKGVAEFFASVDWTRPRSEWSNEVDGDGVPFGEAPFFDGIIDDSYQPGTRAGVQTKWAALRLGHDAELAALEVQRRAERGIGLAIRRGQETGEIRRRGQGGGQPPRSERPRIDSTLSSPEDFASRADLIGNGAGIYQRTDGSIDSARPSGSRRPVDRRYDAA